MTYNKNGGLYERGKGYDLRRKQTVAVEYYQLRSEVGINGITINEVARRAQVGWKYAKKVVEEYEQAATISDPLEKYLQLPTDDKKRSYLTIEEEVYLLALRAEDPTRTNLEYIHLLSTTYGRVVSSSFITSWFKKRFRFPGSFKTPNIVPLDKWRPIYVSRYFEYKCLMHALPLHQLWSFLDEKHIVNRDTVRAKARANPLTGKMDHIPVSGDFRETYNLMAIISLNPEKLKPVEYHIDKDNNNSYTFILFIQHLINVNFLKHNDSLPTKLVGLEDAIANYFYEMLATPGGAVWWEDVQRRKRFMPDSYTVANALLEKRRKNGGKPV